MVKFATLAITALTVVSGTSAQLLIRCPQLSAIQCGFTWVSTGTTNIRQLQDLVRESTGREPSVSQAQSMIFDCNFQNNDPTRPLALRFVRACAVNQCLENNGAICAEGQEVPWP